MTNTINVQMGKRGVVTLPKTLRENYHLRPGDQFTLLDIGGAKVKPIKRRDCVRVLG